MLIIIFYHSIIFWHGGWFIIEPEYPSPVLYNLADVLNSFHVYAFTLISGYIFSYGYNERGKYSSLKSFIFTKVRRLIVPYIFALTVWVIPITQFFFKYSFIEVINRYILCKSPNHLWFLLMLFEVSILVRLFVKKIHTNNLFAIIFPAAIYCLGIIGSQYFDNYFIVWTACSHVSLFILGYKMRQYPNLINVSKWWVYCFAFFASYLSYCFLNSLGTSVYIKLLCSFIGLIMHLFGAVAIYSILQLLSLFINPKGKFVNFIGRYSMTIYLFHQQVIYISVYILNGKVPPLINSIINFILALWISLIIGLILHRYKFTRFLIGEKEL